MDSTLRSGGNRIGITTDESTAAPDTETPTVPVTDAPTETATDAPVEKKGCGSAVMSSALVLLLTAALGTSLLRKREE